MTKSCSQEAFEALVTLEKLSFERATREAIERVLLESLPREATLTPASSDAYPSELLILPEHPPVLVSAGDLSLAERQFRLAVVGSRDATEADKETAYQVARDLAARGCVIVSGLAAGIDAAAHSGALAAEAPDGGPGKTIAVMGTPLSSPWPPANAKLAAAVAARGLLLSICPQVSGLSFTDEERAASLRARNRFVAALACGSLVVTAKAGSSTLIEAAASLKLGRPVLIWHTNVDRGEPWAKTLLAEDLRDEAGNPLVYVVSSADEIEAAVSPWLNVWWL